MGAGGGEAGGPSTSMVFRPGVNTVNYDPYGTLQQSRMAALEDSSGMGSAVAAGIIEGGANSINGAQDALVGTVNLIPLAINKLEGNHVPYVPSADWSRDFAVTESDWTHEKSKLVGGTGVLTLATAGLGAGAAASQTGTIVVQAEGRLAVADAGAAHPGDGRCGRWLGRGHHWPDRADVSGERWRECSKGRSNDQRGAGSDTDCLQGRSRHGEGGRAGFCQDNAGLVCR